MSKANYESLKEESNKEDYLPSEARPTVNEESDNSAKGKSSYCYQAHTSPP